MYSCSQVVKWISSDEYLTAGFFKKLGIRLHLLMCQYCSKYLEQLRTLAATLRQTKTIIPASEVEDAKGRILEQLSRKP